VKNDENSDSKYSQIFKNLMKNREFVKEILNTENGSDIIKKFNLYGVDVDQINFSELCRILARRLKVEPKVIEVQSLCSSAPVDYNKNFNKMFTVADCKYKIH